MSDDELTKKVLSTPPPPTDEIDSEWGGKGAAEEKATKTATAAAEDGTTPATDSGPPGADAKLKQELKGNAETAAAPSTPPPAADEDDEEEDDEDDDSEDEDDEEEDEDDEDEDDEDEDEEEEDARARSSHAPVSRTSHPAAADDWLPDWAPWSVLGGLVLLGVVGGLGAFTHPPAASDDAAPATSAAGAVVEAPTSIEASHFLVQYQGSRSAATTITRTKDEAKKRAAEGLAQVKKGEDFAKVVGEYSDEPGAAARGGALGSFTRDRMIKEFADAAFKLKVGEVSGIVETAFGFHVIKRTK
jgi:parvulin-like peptidyl-prolyl isomerase